MTKKQKKLFDRWKLQRAELDNLEFRWDILVSGCYLVSAFIKSNSYPCGQVWYSQPSSGMLDILHSYVVPWARRAGVRTSIHRGMIEGYPTVREVLTGEASGKKSRRWLKKMGFKYGKTGWKLKVRHD